MRWRTELEVVSGKGQYTCGSLECNQDDALESYELLFNYIEQNHNKQALVKARLCSQCAEKLRISKDLQPKKKSRKTE